MKVTTLTLIILILFSVRIIGQVKISGTVVGDKSELIEFANISLLKQDSTFVSGTTTDSKGTFVFNQIPHGSYIISAAFVGYGKTHVAINNLDRHIDLGNIQLQASDVILKDAVVTANSVIQKSDRQIILPSDAQIRASNSGVALLRNLQLPRININPIDNSITVPGGGAVQLRINGVEVTNAEIIALQPADVIRVEYIDEPGVRYNNAAAVINYITRRKESGGNLSTNLTNAPFKLGFAEDHLSAKVNHKKSEFGVSAYLRYRDLNWTRENKETFNFSDRTVTRTEVGEPTKFHEASFYTTVNYNLQETDKYLFNAILRNNLQDMPNHFSDRISTITSTDNAKPIQVKDHSTWKSYTPSLDLYYQKNLKSDQILILNAVGTYIDSKSTRLYEEKEKDNSMRFFSDIEGDKYSLITEGIYEKKFETSKLTGGVKHTQSYTKNSYMGDVISTVGLNVAETYGYAEYQFRKNKFNYTLGMGLLRSYNSQGENNNEKYIFRPSLSISYNINDNANIRYNGYVSSYPPSLSDLNDIQQQIDAYQIQKGNPNLQTVWYYTHTLNASYQKGIFNSNFFMRYSYDHKPIMEYVYREVDSNDKEWFIRTNTNQKGFHRLYIENTFKLKPWKDYISISLTPRFNRYISYGDDYTHTYSNWGLSGSVMGNYKKWYLNIEGSTRWNWFWGDTHQIGEKYTQLMIGYNNTKWSLGVGAINPFTKYYDTGSVNYSKLTPSESKVFSNNLGNVLIVNFSLNLNFGRQYSAGNKRLNNDDKDAGIMSGSKK